MKDFKFKLEKVLEHRKKIENEHKNKLSFIHKTYKENEAKLSNLKEQDNNWRNSLLEKQNKEIEIKDILLYHSHLSALERGINLQEHKVKDLSVQVDTARQKLISARKDKRMMEKLKDKAYVNYKYIAAKSEQKQNDDIGTHRFIKNKEPNF